MEEDLQRQDQHADEEPGHHRPQQAPPRQSSSSSGDPYQQHRRDAEEEEPRLRADDLHPSRHRDRLAQGELLGETRREDVSKEHGEHGSDDHADHYQEPQLLPAVVDDEHAHQVMVA